MVERRQDLINHKDDDGCTPLHLAILEDESDIATYLIQQVRSSNLVKLNG